MTAQDIHDLFLLLIVGGFMCGLFAAALAIGRWFGRRR